MVLRDPALAAKKRRERRSGAGGGGNFVSDELYFNDDFESGLAYGEDYDSDRNRARAKEERRRNGTPDIVLTRALDRIQRAKEKGKPSVSLTHEELAALGRRDLDSPRGTDDRARSSRRKHRTRGGSGSSRSSSDNGVRGTRKKAHRSRSGSGFFGGPASPRPSNKRNKGSRSDNEGRSSGITRERSDTPPRASRAAYAPVSYFNARTDRRAASGDESRSRPSTGKSSRTASNNTPPPLRERHSDEPPYPPGQTYRAYNPNMSAPRDRGYVRSGPRSPPYPMPDSVGRYEMHSDGGRLSPAARQSHPSQNSSRRIVSGPADLAYSNVIRRVPVGAQRPHMAHHPAGGSDPSLDRRRLRDLARDEEEDDDRAGSEDEDEEAVEEEDGEDFRRRREHARRSPSGTPPAAVNNGGFGRNRSGSTGWQRRKR